MSSDGASIQSMDPRGTGADLISAAIRRASGSGRPAIAAFLTGGFPSRRAFPGLLASAVAEADLVEVGVPFSDPMADGLTIQRSSRAALLDGTTLPWILDTVAGISGTKGEAGTAPSQAAPVFLMSYLNPIMAHGFERFADDAARAGVAGLIVPDLPLEESDELRSALDAEAIALVQLVTPATPPGRLELVCQASRGFVYAVTMKGTTGANVDLDSVGEYLRRVRGVTSLPVLAGFGVRSASDVATLGRMADGVIVGSALVEAIEEGRDPAEFVREMRGEGVGS
jgi:tryptophan synthase alpha chain